MIARIGCIQLEVSCIIGTEAEERKIPQNLLVDVDLSYDIGAAAASDDLSQGIDYTDLCQVVQAHLCEGKYHLLERAAQTLVQVLQARYPQAVALHLKIIKNLPSHPPYFIELSWKMP